MGNRFFQPAIVIWSATGFSVGIVALSCLFNWATVRVLKIYDYISAWVNR